MIGELEFGFEFGCEIHLGFWVDVLFFKIHKFFAFFVFVFLK